MIRMVCYIVKETKCKCKVRKSNFCIIHCFQTEEQLINQSAIHHLRPYELIEELDL